MNSEDLNSDRAARLTTETELAELRRELETIDRELIVLLSRRQQFCEKIGKVKSQANLSIRQLEYWEKSARLRQEHASRCGLNPAWLQRIWDEIHELSVSCQKHSHDQNPS